MVRIEGSHVELGGGGPDSLSLLGGVADLLDEGIAVVRRDDGCVLEANNALRELLGLHPDGVWSLRDNVPVQHGPRVDQLLNVRTRHAAQLTIVGEDAPPRNVDVNALALDAWRVLVEVRDASTQALVQRQLAQAQQRLRMTFDSAPIGMGLATLGGVLLEPNPALDALLAGEGASVVGRSLADLLDDEHLPELLAAFGHVTSNATSIRLQVHATTTGRWVLLTLSRVEREDEATTQVLVQAEDVTAQRAVEQHLEHQRLHDDLTGVANRALLRDRLAMALARRERGRGDVVLMFVDLDGFKEVNDRGGHAAGDLALREVASRLRDTLRPEDTVARMGGDEFVVLLEGLVDTVEQARMVATRIHTALGRPMDLEQGTFELGASIGITIADDHDDPEELLREADLAMYRAKRQPDIHWAFFDDDLRLRADSRAHAETSLRAALAGNGIEVHYQPIIDLTDGHVAGVEALVRLRDPSGELVAPGAFLDVAEDTGLVVQMGERVLRRACRQGAAWREEHPDVHLHVAVNVSLRQLYDPFVDVVRDTLATTGLPAEALVLEVTESLLLSAAPRAHKVLERLSALGVGLAMDDFGTGASSLSYLRTFPVHAIKADRSFVSNAAHDPLDLAIVQTVVDLGERLGMDVVAEGVETFDDLEILLGMGAQYGQGYLFSRPLPAVEVGELLDRRVDIDRARGGAAWSAATSGKLVPLRRALAG